MPPDDQNEFFGHLSQPSDSDRRRSIPLSNDQDYESVPDPFGDAEIVEGHPLSSSGLSANLPTRGRSRGRQSSPDMEPVEEAPADEIQSPSELNNVKPQAAVPTPISTRKPAARQTKSQISGPGLSPGLPAVRNKTQSLPRSDGGIVLTPSGVQRVPSEPAQARPASKLDIPKPATEEDSFYEQSRGQNADDDVSWEEYAADDFPAMAAQDFGVKTAKTESGRIVPVAVRSDLTDEALKDRSIGSKGKSKHKPLPSPKDENAKKAPKSFFGKVSDSLRLTTVDHGSSDTGFAKSGSKPRTKKLTKLGIAWWIASEVGKIFILVLVLRAYVVQVSKVRGPSMEGTLFENERLIVERITPMMHNNRTEPWLGWIPRSVMPSPSRGDIVVIRSPEDPGIELVKRLIALGGDEIKFEEQKLYIKKAGSSEFEIVDEYYLNAESLKNPDGTFNSYVLGDIPSIMDDGEPLKIPEGKIFVMGDNREASNDSRRWLDIAINKNSNASVKVLWATEGSIEGRVVFRLWPTDRVGSP